MAPCATGWARSGIAPTPKNRIAPTTTTDVLTCAWVARGVTPLASGDSARELFKIVPSNTRNQRADSPCSPERTARHRQNTANREMQSAMDMKSVIARVENERIAHQLLAALELTRSGENHPGMVK